VNSAATAPNRVLRARREKIVIVTRKTALEELVARFNTVGQAKFYLEHAGQDFAPIEAAHQKYHAVLDGVRTLVPSGVRSQVIERGFLPQFAFAESDLVVTVGPDGLVVNTAKYLDGQPIVAVNPDPARIEGVLLPFTARELRRPITAAVYGDPAMHRITMAEAVLNDGQRLLAFNDLFIGARSHVSARYRIEAGDRAEEQSSSGILVSTGAGSTGWLKSVYTGAARVIDALGGKVEAPPEGGRFPWDAEWLVYAVREPWPSKSRVRPDHAGPASGDRFAHGRERSHLQRWRGSRLPGLHCRPHRDDPDRGEEGDFSDAYLNRARVERFTFPFSSRLRGGLQRGFPQSQLC
jgi:NAD kinase